MQAPLSIIIAINNLVINLLTWWETWKRELAESINEKPSNLIKIIRKKIHDCWRKNLNKKVVDEKPSNLIDNWRRKLKLYK